MIYFKENAKRCLYPFNTFTADNEYTFHIRVNLPLQKQLSKKRMTFYALFILFSESTLNYEPLEETISAIG